MSELDAVTKLVDGWLQPIESEVGTCGLDLEGDSDKKYAEFAIVLKGKEAVPSFSKDVAATPADPPNWERVRALSEDLFERTRDLRIAIGWFRSVLYQEGIGALPIGLRLLQGLLCRFWEELHPLPDPSDKDPWARANALALLGQPEYVLGDVQQVTLVTNRVLGPLRFRDVELALGTKKPRADETVLTREQISQVLAEAFETDDSLRPQLAQSLDILTSMVEFVDERIPHDTPDLSPLIALLRSVNSLLPAPPDEAQPEDPEDHVEDRGTDRPRGVLAGTVQSRADAVRAIDLVCDYLERSEPTSPAQLLLRRAQRLIARNFLQLIKELAPDSLSEVARVMGVDPATVKLPGEEGADGT